MLGPMIHAWVHFQVWAVRMAKLYQSIPICTQDFQTRPGSCSCTFPRVGCSELGSLAMFHSGFCSKPALRKERIMTYYIIYTYDIHLVHTVSVSVQALDSQNWKHDSLCIRTGGFFESKKESKVQLFQSYQVCLAIAASCHIYGYQFAIISTMFLQLTVVFNA